MPEKPLISIQNISKSFREGDQVRRVLDEAYLDIGQGEFVSILGKSGSGKSTLLNLISGIDLPDSGKIIIDGQNIFNLSSNDLTIYRRENIGFVFQFFNLIPTLSTIENVTLPLELNGTPYSSAKERGMEYLEIVGLSDRSNTFPDKLSGGEQQRVAVARALVHNPPIILADEPTGNLDSSTGEQIMNLLECLVRKYQKNLIMVTHNTAYTKRADSNYQLKNGNLSPVNEG